MRVCDYRGKLGWRRNSTTEFAATQDALCLNYAGLPLTLCERIVDITIAKRELHTSLGHLFSPETSKVALYISM